MTAHAFWVSLGRAVYMAASFGPLTTALDVLDGTDDWSWGRAAVRGALMGIFLLVVEVLTQKLSRRAQLQAQAQQAIVRGQVPVGADPATWWTLVERERPTPASIAGRSVFVPLLVVVLLGLAAARQDDPSLWVLVGCWVIAAAVGVLRGLDRRERADRLLGSFARAAGSGLREVPQSPAFQGSSRAAGREDPWTA